MTLLIFLMRIFHELNGNDKVNMMYKYISFITLFIHRKWAQLRQYVLQPFQRHSRWEMGYHWKTLQKHSLWRISWFRPNKEDRSVIFLNQNRVILGKKRVGDDIAMIKCHASVTLALLGCGHCDKSSAGDFKNSL